MVRVHRFRVQRFKVQMRYVFNPERGTLNPEPLNMVILHKNYNI